MPSGSRHALSVCVVTAARSEYGAIRWVLDELLARPGMTLQLVVTGAHLSERHGLTYREIEADGITIAERVPVDVDAGGAADLAFAQGALVSGLARAFERLQPDLVLFMGDRYELLAVIQACVIMTIPMGHLSGGEVTEGALDEQVRHAATKAAHLHFVTNEDHARRVRQMGEEDWRVCVTGEPALDAIFRMPRIAPEELRRSLGMATSGPLGLVTFHPVTLRPECQADDLAALDQAMRWAARERGVSFLLTHPNADAGREAIVSAWERFVAETPGSALVRSLGHHRYISALAAADLMLGNSSSGLIEAPSLNLPVVNIGDRQAGRTRGENVIDVGSDYRSIAEGIAAALAYDRSRPIDNPYGGDGQSSKRVVDFIESACASRSRSGLLHKRFVDL
jgi:UDP-hydrolysing UDP-N-acetyl-D-glucosamine 2-epimerase